MALPKKDRREIHVDGHDYSWIASGNDDFICLIITSIRGQGQRLIAQFDYHSLHIKGEAEAVSARQRISITPFIVKQVINHGLQSGWIPEKNGKELWLGFLDDKIDLGINTKE